MAIMQLTLESLKHLGNGLVAKAFEHEIKRCVQDCIDRPQDKHARTVTLELSITPVVGTDGGIVECEGAEADFQIKGKVPVRKSRTYSLRVNKQGQLAFSSESPENVDQLTFDDVDPASGKVNREPPAAK